MASHLENNFAEIAEKILASIYKNLDQGWTPAEFTLFSLFLLAGLRNPNRPHLQIDARAQNLSPAELQANGLDLKFLFQHLSENLPQPIFESCFASSFKALKNIPPEQKLIQLCPYWRWRNVPAVVWKSLQQWHEGKFDLQLRFDIPTPQQVLQLQIKGQRCVSVFNEAQDLKKIHDHERDAFLFTVHDLEHAWQFFSRPSLFSYQKEWCRLLHLAFALGPWKSFIEPAVSDSFNYLISDMNSHPWHAYLTLRHLWRQNWKCKHGITLKDQLSVDEEKLCNQAWQQLLQFWNLSELEQIEASEQIPFFLKRISPSHDDLLENRII